MEETAEHPSGEYSVLEDMALHCTFLMERLNEQRLLQPDLCDVDIVLLRHKATFQAHKGVLAAYSPFFHSLFASSKELQRVELSLEALRPQGFVQILDFIYTSRLLVNSGNARDVLRAATVLQMANVASSCRELLSRGSLQDEQPERDIQTWRNSNGNGGGGDSNFSMQIKQEQDASSAKIFGTNSERSPYVAHIVERQHLGTGKEECNMDMSRDSEDSFNRKQIIVELNLNNQTLNVSKGPEGSCSSAAPSGFEAEKDNGTSEEDREPSEGEDEVPMGTSEDEAGEAPRLDFGTPKFLSQRYRRQTRSSVDALATVTMRTSMRVRHGGRVGVGVSVRGEEEQEEGLGQNARLDERRSFPCVRCPRVFTNSWDMEMHANVEHNYMLRCDKCGTRFLLDSELLLHQQTDCEKNLQVHTHAHTRSKRSLSNNDIKVAHRCPDNKAHLLIY